MPVGPKWWLPTLALTVAILSSATLWPYARAAALLADFSGERPTWRGWLPGPFPASASDIVVPTRHGPVDARVYRPAAPSHTVVVFPGVHGGGANEPRLATFCDRLAATGRTVVCAPVPELRLFEVTARSTDGIEDVTAWVARQPGLAPSGRVTLVGVSFAGGLALVAAGRPSLTDRLEAVLSLGGHGDLPRVLQFLCTGQLDDGTRLVPHDYGLAVVAYAAVARLVPADQVEGLTSGVRMALDAAMQEDPEGARASGSAADPLTARARAAAAALPEPSRTILTLVLDKDRVRLGARLAPLVADLGGDPALSPERAPMASAPVFLLHGRDDTVIPAAETAALNRALTRAGHAPRAVLITPLLTHASLTHSSRVGDTWRLVRFWAQVLDALP